MQDLKLIKTIKNEQKARIGQKIFFRYVHYLFIRLIVFYLLYCPQSPR